MGGGSRFFVVDNAVVLETAAVIGSHALALCGILACHARIDSRMWYPAIRRLMQLIGRSRPSVFAAPARAGGAEADWGGAAEELSWRPEVQFVYAAAGSGSVAGREVCRSGGTVYGRRCGDGARSGESGRSECGGRAGRYGE